MKFRQDDVARETRRPKFAGWWPLMAAIGTALHLSVCAQGYPGKAHVRAVQGIVTYSDEDGANMPLKAGTVLHPGTVIRSQSTGAADLELDGGAGVVRLLAQSGLVLDKLQMQGSRSEAVVQIDLKLTEGSLIGHAAKLRTGTRYTIHTPLGAAAIAEGLFRLDASGQVVAVQGALVWTANGGSASPLSLRAPPATAFTPDQGVQAASAGLARQVEEQFKVKLRKR